MNTLLAILLSVMVIKLSYILLKASKSPLFKHLPWQRKGFYPVFRYMLRYKNEQPVYGLIQILFWKKEFGELPKVGMTVEEAKKLIKAGSASFKSHTDVYKDMVAHVREPFFKKVAEEDGVLGGVIFSKTKEEREKLFDEMNIEFRKREFQETFERRIKILAEILNHKP